MSTLAKLQVQTLIPGHCETVYVWVPAPTPPPPSSPGGQSPPYTYTTTEQVQVPIYDCGPDDSLDVGGSPACVLVGYTVQQVTTTHTVPQSSGAPGGGGLPDTVQGSYQAQENCIPDRYVMEDHQGWNAGARSIPKLVDNGYYEFKASPDALGIVTGLTPYNENQDWKAIQFGFHIQKSQARVVESGVFRTGFFNFLDSTNTFRIERTDSGTIKYYRNGVLLHTSDTPGYGVLFADASFYRSGDEISDYALVETAPTAIPDPEATPSSGDFNLLAAPGIVRIVSHPADAEGVNSFELSAAPGRVEINQNQYIPQWNHFDLRAIGSTVTMYGYVPEVGNFDLLSAPGQIKITDQPLNVFELAGAGGQLLRFHNYRRLDGVLKASYPAPKAQIRFANGAADIPIINVRANYPAPTAQMVLRQGAAHASYPAPKPAIKLMVGLGATLGAAYPAPTAAVKLRVPSSIVVAAAYPAPTARAVLHVHGAGGARYPAPKARIRLSVAIGIGLYANYPAPAARLQMVGANGLKLAARYPAPKAHMLLDQGLRRSRIRYPAPRARLIIGAGVNALDPDQTAWVINTDNFAVSRYTRYPFERFIKIGARHWGVYNGALYLLEGDTDAGQPIQALARTFATDLNDSRLKRLLYLLLGVRSSAPIRVVTIFDEETGETYQVSPRARSTPQRGAHSVRVRLKHGLTSRYFQIQIENVAGGDLDIESIEPELEILDRRL